MPFWKWLIFIVFIVLVLGLSLFLYCALKISSKNAREEERRIKYKKIIKDNIINFEYKTKNNRTFLLLI